MGANDKQRNKYVTFKSGNEYFGLKIEYVNEIIVYQEITEIPESEDYIKGLIGSLKQADSVKYIILVNHSAICEFTILNICLDYFHSILIKLYKNSLTSSTA